MGNLAKLSVYSRGRGGKNWMMPDARAPMEAVQITVRVWNVSPVVVRIVTPSALRLMLSTGVLSLMFRPVPRLRMKFPMPLRMMKASPGVAKFAGEGTRRL
jgi:hypothetical protein